MDASVVLLTIYGFKNRFVMSRLKNQFFETLVLVLLLLVTGVFWGTWFTLTRSIELFSAQEFVHIGRVIIANVAAPMRLLVPACTLLLLINLWQHFRRNRVYFYLCVLSFILLLVALLVTLIVMVPIDNHIKEWTPATMPADWEVIRYKWKVFHAFRTFTCLASFICYSFFLLANRPKI
jgi:hypothetical protein